MAIVVEHDKRKSEILDKSLDIFVEEGYEDVTYQKIADRCGITRTTLYVYFGVSPSENGRSRLKKSPGLFPGQLLKKSILISTI